PDLWSRVGASVGAGVEPLAVQEVVFDELVVSVERQDLVVDDALPGVGADDDAGHAEPVAVLVDYRRPHLIIKPAPVIPGQEDGGGGPVRTLHDRVDQAGDIGLAR